MFEHIVDPYPVDFLLLALQVKGTKALNSVTLEGPAEPVPICHVQRPKTLLVVHLELSLIVCPVQLRKVELLINGLLYHSRGVLVVQDSKAMKAIAFPAPRIAHFTTGVIKNSISFKLTFGIELTFVSGTILEVQVSIRPVAYFCGLRHSLFMFLNKVGLILDVDDGGW